MRLSRNKVVLDFKYLVYVEHDGEWKDRSEGMNGKNLSHRVVISGVSEYRRENMKRG